MNYGDTASEDLTAKMSDADFWNPLAIALPVARQLPTDFWLPSGLQLHALAIEQPAVSPDLQYDFWAPHAASEPEDNRLPPDWGMDRSLPWFDPELRENPYFVDDGLAPSQFLAMRRGRWLAMLAYLPSPRRRASFAEYFGELFQRFPTQQTFRALSDLALADVDADTIRSACDFRIDFLETPLFHARRSPSSRAAYPYHDPSSMLSWRRAVRIVSLSGGDPSSIIEDRWYSEWLDLPTEHALYWAYLDYVEWRIKVWSLGYWAFQAETPRVGATLDDHTLDEIYQLRKFSRTGRLVHGESNVIGPADGLPSRDLISALRVKDGNYSRHQLLDN